MTDFKHINGVEEIQYSLRESKPITALCGLVRVLRVEEWEARKSLLECPDCSRIHANMALTGQAGEKVDRSLDEVLAWVEPELRPIWFTYQVSNGQQWPLAEGSAS